MIAALVNSTAAELVKLRTLPEVLAAMLGTVVAAITLAAIVAATPAGAGADTVHVTLQTIPFLQIGLIVIGVLCVGSEYTGSQIRATLTATPNRPLLLTSKTLAYLAVAAITSAAAVGAGLATAWITLSGHDRAQSGTASRWPALGAVVYLVLIGLLGFALAVLLRSLITPLVTMLSLVLIASPLLGPFTEYTRYLPDGAGSLLYLPDTDTVLTPETGTLVLLAWITATGAAAVTAFLGRDA
jgi:ABC-2 type transport system permease protein